MITQDELLYLTADETLRCIIASSAECPRHRKRKLFAPECGAVRSGSLIHNDLRSCILQHVRPSPRVLDGG
jgi:hypothetical protein